MRREFLQLAKTYDSNKHAVGNWFLSEKLDGMRCYWDGGWSRGKLASDVPFANTVKNDRLVDEPVATGLWSRYGNVIRAPDWFLDNLPMGFQLDGELYMGRGEFQTVMSVVKRFKADARWKDVCYIVFDSPSSYHMFSPGKINNPNFKLMMPDLRHLIPDTGPVPFYKTLRLMDKNVLQSVNLRVHHQANLPVTTIDSQMVIDSMLELICNRGGEGLMLRKPEAEWVPKRVDTILKVKSFLDSEAEVIGYTWGKGKLDGVMGAMIIKWQNKSFELSGFTDAERKMSDCIFAHPGSLVAEGEYNPTFPIGSTVAFKYSELSKTGIPLKARYWRKHE